jgi:type I restriction enzyme M protein
MSQNILQYESKVWATADLLRGSGIKESEWPSMMMPFFALVMIESRLVRMFEELRAEIGEESIAEMDKQDLYELIRDRGQGYNSHLFERNLTLKDICKNDKTFELDFSGYLSAFDGETKDLLGVEASEGDKFLDIRGVISKLRTKKVLLGYTKAWSEIDLLPFNNSEITTLEEHIKRKWADMSAETAGEQYTPDDIIALISEIIASKIEESDQLLKIYDCTCGGGNLLFGVEDRIKEKFRRFTATYGQDWNDALYAMAKIESRFRSDSKIEYGNTLNDDKFSNDEFDVATANPPYGVDWKGYSKSIEDDKTGRFHYLPSVGDGQLLFMQHIISKLNANGLAVVVHNGSTLFSGDAGSAESNIRKWMLDKDLVEAVIQNPTSEFFNTDIYTYLWVINKNKASERKNQILLIDASQKFTPLKKGKGEKRNEIDAANRGEIVEALARFEDCEFARRFSKYHFYFNEQAIELTNVDEEGKTFADRLPMVTKRDGSQERAKSMALAPVSLSDGKTTLTEFVILDYDKFAYDSLSEAFELYWKPWVAGLDYKEQPLTVTTADARYHFDNERETLVKTTAKGEEALGCGKIVVKATFKKETKKLPERIEISIELMPDKQKDFEIIPFDPDPTENSKGIEEFLSKYVFKPFVILINNVGVGINFNRVFQRPLQIGSYKDISMKLASIEALLRKIEHERERLKSDILPKEIIQQGELKDSGYDWIGKIPKRWSVTRVVDLARERKFKNTCLQEKNLLSLSYGKIKRKDINTSTGLLPDSFETYQIVEKGNIVLRLTDLQNDWKSLRVGLVEERGIITSAYLCLQFSKKVVPAYAYALLHYYDLSKVFYWLGGGLRQSMKFDDIKVLPFILPPINEQEFIALYLKQRTAEIDRIVRDLMSEIDLLKDIKPALFSDLVTGRVGCSS